MSQNQKEVEVETEISDLEKECFSFQSFYQRFSAYPGIDELLSYIKRDGRLEACQLVGTESCRKDLPKGYIFIYRFPIERLSHMGGFAHKTTDPDDCQIIWIFIALEKQEVIYSGDAKSLEEKLGKNYNLMPLNARNYLLEGQEEEIARAYKYLELPFNAKIEVDGKVWQKQIVRRDISIFELDDISLRGAYSFRAHLMKQALREVWKNENGEELTSEQLAGLYNRYKTLVADSFSLKSHFKERGQAKQSFIPKSKSCSIVAGFTSK